jgi:hypothetical protein
LLRNRTIAPTLFFTPVLTEAIRDVVIAPTKGTIAPTLFFTPVLTEAIRDVVIAPTKGKISYLSPPW